jgi:hypothetical protein
MKIRIGVVLAVALAAVIAAVVVTLVWINKHREGFSDLYLGTSSKSFDAQHDMKRGYEFLGNKQSCFSCEQQLLRTGGPAAATFAGSNRCMSCERQMQGQDTTYLGIASG